LSHTKEYFPAFTLIVKIPLNNHDWNFQRAAFINVVTKEKMRDDALVISNIKILFDQKKINAAS